jgi:hypothetical protein
MNVTINKLTKGVALYNSKDPPVITDCDGYQRNYATIEVCEIQVLGELILWK